MRMFTAACLQKFSKVSTILNILGKMTMTLLLESERRGSVACSWLLHTFSKVSALPKLRSKMTMQLTFENVHCVTSEITCRFFVPATHILKSQHSTQFTVLNDNGANCSEFPPQHVRNGASRVLHCTKNSRKSA